MTRKSCLTSMLMILIIVAGGQVSGVRAFDIFGTVSEDATGDPVEFVEVQVYFNGNPVGGANDITDNNGDYFITGLPGATYDVDFQPPQDSGLRPKLVADVPVFGDVQLDVALQYGVKIDGYVRDTDGIGIPGIDLNIYDQVSGDQLDIPGDNTDEFGYYDVFVPPGLFRIVYRPVEGERYVPVELTNVDVVQDTTIDVVLEDGFFIQGTVSGPNGAVVGADIDVEDPETGRKLYTPGDLTDGNGFYRITLPAGTFNISVDPPDGTRLIPEILNGYQVFQDATLNFSLENGFFLSGTVRDPVNSPVVNADIDVTDPATGVKLFTPGDQTDALGAYEVVVPAGTYDIDYKPPVGPPPYLACLRLESRNISGDEVINVNVPYGVLLSGTVSDYNGAGVLNVDIDAIDPPTDITLPTVGDHTDDQGYFATVLEAGTYHLEFEPPSNRHLAAEKLFDYVLNTDSYVEMPLDSGMVVSGTVAFPDGSPMPDVEVTAVESSTQEEAFTPGNSTDEAGLYSITVKPNTYDLTFSPDPIHGFTDSTMYNIDIFTDMVINVQFGEQEPDTEPPTVIVVAPNGGEIWPANSNQNITWSASDNVGVTSIDIYYSVDGLNGTYMLITSAEPNDGGFIWAVPSSPSEDAWVRIVAHDAAGNSGDDYSDAAFTITLPDSEPPTVTVISPNGGESWPVYSVQVISWSASDNVGVTSIDLYYSIDGQNGTYMPISSGETDDGFYAWIVPPTPTEDAWVKIIAFDASSNSGQDISDGAFTIYSNPSDCAYVPGDVNHNGVPVELADVISMIGIYRGTVSPSYTCPCPPHGDSFAPEADPNGNCTATELSDVITEIGAYRGTATAIGCVDCPGVRRMAPEGDTGAPASLDMENRIK